MQPSPEPNESAETWQHIAPYLDEAMNGTLVAISTSASVERDDVVMAMDQAHDAAARAVYLQWQRMVAKDRAMS